MSTALSTVVLARTAGAEWSRIWSVRSSWWFTLAIAVVVVGMAIVLSVDLAGNPGEAPDGQAWIVGQFSGTLGMFVIVAAALVNATADHGTGGIVPTLQWTPRREILLTARAAVIVATTSGIGVLAVAAASLAGWAITPHLGLPADEGLRILGTVAFVYVAGSALAVGLGLALRSTAGGLVSVIGLMLVLPLLLTMLWNFGFDWAETLAELLPGAGALHLMVDGEPFPGLTATAARVTMAAWAVAALVAGGWRLLRHDADR